MGIPIPTIYLCVEEDNTYSVIDGQQRITSLIRYLKNEYALNGLQELNELNGKYYKDLPKDISAFHCSTHKAVWICRPHKTHLHGMLHREHRDNVL